MTPGARLSAAIEVLDSILSGQPVEPALTIWARGHRFAGSGDRYAIRDLVFDVLRCRRSCAAFGGADTGRGLVLGLARQQGSVGLFDGQGHAPQPPGDDEAGFAPTEAQALDLPDWLVPLMKTALGADAAATALALRQRAPVFVRANLARTTRDAVARHLDLEGIEAVPVAQSNSALQVTENARKIQIGQTYLSGLIELQDLSSQLVVEALPLADGMRVLDYCAGGGGKTLAMAARARLTLYAHDAAPQRMRDLPERAARAGAQVALTASPTAQAPFDLILTDVPCSGSGSWRRDPMGKWALTPQRLAELTQIQAEILDQTATWVAPEGRLAYATCSLLDVENELQIQAFLTRHPGWTCDLQRRWNPVQGGDGFFLALLTPPYGRPTQL